MNKSDKLNKMAIDGISVAQFISVDKGDLTKPKYIHIYNKQLDPNISIKNAVLELIDRSLSKTVNIRSYGEIESKGKRFEMNKGKHDIDAICQIIKENSDEGLDSIVNENIDISDGGVSGVVIGDVVEFSPDDTPRCVEKPGVCSLPRQIGLDMLEAVYGFKPSIPFEKDYRVEFSIHPLKQGINHSHTIIWEYEKMEQVSTAHIDFPNNFSKHLGDKVFGLLLASKLGFKVPYSTVISRKVAPFSFGETTGSNEIWTRTAPVVKQAGLFTTCKGWVDPYKLMIKEDRNHLDIGAIISQQSVEGLYSGAALVKENEIHDIIEGVTGDGDAFMVGEDDVTNLPLNVINEVKKTSNRLRGIDGLGEVSFEWVYDGKDIWVVQLNKLKNSSSKPNTIVDGVVTEYVLFNVNRGLEELRELLRGIDKKVTGIKLVGNIGIASHFGDLLRQNQIPSIIVRG